MKSADLRLAENISALKRAAGQLGQIRKRVFLIDRKNRLSVVQAHALGATHVLPSSVSKPLLLAKLIDQVRPDFASGEVLSGALAPAQAGAAASHRRFWPYQPGRRSMSVTRKTPPAGSRTPLRKRACPIGSRRFASTMKEPISIACWSPT
ncbi:hypothetical protein [Bradyrhizobium sp.]|uniref:hypothetical protein n=1 Tax=Bradyrhizobium sp. TaxID=376 RepID=UPI00260FDED3|nr:hypothetical protein [Bradyrhizobium sp.]